MCNLSEGVYSNGVLDGILREREESLRNLMENTGWSLEKAMEMLRIPPEEKEHFEKELKKQH